jgi:hypothetical protein
MITGISTALAGWSQDFNGWGDEVDSSDSDFQGSAAGALKQKLIEFKNQLGGIHTQLTTPDVAGTLQLAGDAMMNAAKTLMDARTNWAYTRTPTRPGSSRSSSCTRFLLPHSTRPRPPSTHSTEAPT